MILATCTSMTILGIGIVIYVYQSNATAKEKEADQVKTAVRRVDALFMDQDKKIPADSLTDSDLQQAEEAVKKVDNPAKRLRLFNKVRIADQMVKYEKLEKKIKEIRNEKEKSERIPELERLKKEIEKDIKRSIPKPVNPK